MGRRLPHRANLIPPTRPPGSADFLKPSDPTNGPAIAPAIAHSIPQVVTAVDITAIAMGHRSSKTVGSDVVNEDCGKIGNKLIAVRHDELRPTTDGKSFILVGTTDVLL